MSDIIFSVRLLGDFQITMNNRPITIENNKPTKANLILQYLLFNLEKGVSKEQLIKTFFDGDDIVDPENNLKVNIHRLRKLLKDAMNDNLDFIKIKKSVYFINKELSVVTDYEEFKNAIMMAEDTDNKEKRIEYLENAMELYGNELLPYLSTLPDVAYENVQMKESFINHALELIHIRDDYKKNIELINKAINIYQYDDELYVTKLRLLIKEKEYKEATEFYTKTTKFFMESLGVEDMPTLRSEYQNMSNNISNSIADIVDVRETIKEDEEPMNAYYCNYLSFIDNYHIVSRLMTRMGRSVYMMLCTIAPHANIDELNEINNSVHTAIEKSLRSGDIFTCYNVNQFIVLLCNMQQENMNIVIDRITNYLKKNTKVDIDDITFTSISALDDFK